VNRNVPTRRSETCARRPNDSVRQKLRWSGVEAEKRKGQNILVDVVGAEIVGRHLVVCCLLFVFSIHSPGVSIRNEMIRRRCNGISRDGNNANQIRSRALCG